MVEFLGLEEVLMAAVDYCAYGRPYTKSTRLYVEQSAAVGATGADGEWSVSRERQQAPQNSSRWWGPGPRHRVSGRQVGGAAGANEELVEAMKWSVGGGLLMVE